MWFKKNLLQFYATHSFYFVKLNFHLSHSWSRKSHNTYFWWELEEPGYLVGHSPSDKVLLLSGTGSVSIRQRLLWCFDIYNSTKNESKCNLTPEFHYELHVNKLFGNLHIKFCNKLSVVKIVSEQKQLWTRVTTHLKANTILMLGRT